MSDNALIPVEQVSTPDEARSSYRIALDRGDKALAQRYYEREYQLLGGSPSHSADPDFDHRNLPAKISELTAAWRSDYSTEWPQVVQKLGSPESPRFQQAVDLAVRLASKLQSDYPQLDHVFGGSTGSAVYIPKGRPKKAEEFRYLGSSPILVLALADLAASKFGAPRDGRQQQPHGGRSGDPAPVTGDIEAQIEAVRARKRQALASGNHALALQLDAEEYELHKAVVGDQPIVGTGNRSV